MGYIPFVGSPDPLGVLKPAVYSDVGGHGASQTVLSPLDVYTPFFRTEIYARQALMPGFNLVVDMLGFSSGHSSPKVGHYEDERAKAPIYIGAIATAAAGAGNDMVVTLGADSMYDAGVTVGTQSRQASPGRISERILLPNNELAQIVDKDTSVTPHRLVLRPVNANTDLDVQIQAGAVLAISGNAHGEGTGMMRGQLPRVFKYVNDFQIVKEACASSGTDLTNQTYFEPIPNRQGSFFLRVEWMTIHNFEDAQSQVLLFGTPGENIKVNSPRLGYDVPVTSTQGLLHFARNNGYNDTYDPANFGLADFDEWSRLLLRERVGTMEVCGWLGYDLYITIENALQEFVNGGANISHQLTKERFMGQSLSNDPLNGYTAEDLAVSIGFTAIKKGGFTYSFKWCHEFNDARGAGLDAYKFMKTGVFHPLGYVRDYNAGGTTPIIGMHWKQLGNYSRRQVISPLNGAGVNGAGGIAPTAVNEYDMAEIAFTSEIAMHCTTGNHFLYIEPA